MTKRLYRKMEPGYYHELLEKERYKKFKSRGTVQRHWHLQRFKEIVALIPTKNKIILDLGCGPGTLLSMLKQDYKKAVGVDFDEKQIDYAKKRFGNFRKIKWISGDINKLKLSEKFDVIILSEVIEHVRPKDAGKLLRRINELLKENGKFIITTPNYASVYPVIEWFVNRLGSVNYEEQHINKQTLKSLKTLLEKNGFQIERWKTISIIGPFLVPISKKIALFVERIERKIMPALGSVIIMSARKKGARI